MTVVCLILGILCLLYYTAIVLYSGITTSFAWFWAASGILLLIFSLILRRNAHRLLPQERTASYVIYGILIASISFLVFWGWQIIGAMSQPPVPELDYAVVLGAQVKGRIPSRSLAKRLEAALDYAQKNPDTVLILSGGKGPGEEITEAKCMFHYLTLHGVEEDRLILEENSTTTLENLQFSDTMTGCSRGSCGIVSNNFHIFRALNTAKSLGYTDPHGICASSDGLLLPHLIVREVFASTRDFVKSCLPG